MFVKVAKLGSAVVTVMLEDNASTAAALAAAGMDATGFQARVNGAVSDAPLKDGDTITLVPAIKGGSGEFTVKVAKLGAAVKEVFLAEGSDIEDALEAAGMDATGFQTRVNGAAPTGELKSGDTITLVPAIKGGK
jgi:sulfur carrier protein ThiS